MAPFTGVYALSTGSNDAATFAMTRNRLWSPARRMRTRYPAQDFSRAVYGGGSAIMTDGGAAQDITEGDAGYCSTTWEISLSPLPSLCGIMVWTVVQSFALARLTP
ncbi:MAG: hypothetical protein IPK17_19780 [Chloroflexi bacterium]|uniref:hypothetical protein n=1 Tax=Candidatus Flexifilum breve TaxID=3140694 RepID=UPI0031371BFE|nr:hypothetical protein [Chloroflexota bacterium]